MRIVGKCQSDQGQPEGSFFYVVGVGGNDVALLQEWQYTNTLVLTLPNLESLVNFSTLAGDWTEISRMAGKRLVLKVQNYTMVIVQIPSESSKRDNYFNFEERD